GNNPFVPGIGGALTDILLSAGSYTLAVGGNEGFFDTFTDYAYSVNVTLDEVSVSAPGTICVLMLGLIGIVTTRKRV
ncbi:MAG: PEP-CTERM sorting domain-containing protein, partial [Paraglaciecola chathamensis]